MVYSTIYYKVCEYLQCVVVCECINNYSVRVVFVYACGCIDIYNVCGIGECVDV